MPPGSEQAINAAVQSGRWEAVALVVIMLIVTGFLVFIVRQIMDQALKREERLAGRVDGLEAFIRDEFMKVVKENTKAMLTIHISAAETTAAVTQLISSLHTTRICFATGEAQTKLVDTIASRVVKEIQAAAHEHLLEVREP